MSLCMLNAECGMKSEREKVKQIHCEKMKPNMDMNMLRAKSLAHKCGER